MNKVYNRKEPNDLYPDKINEYKYFIGKDGKVHGELKIWHQSGSPIKQEINGIKYLVAPHKLREPYLSVQHFKYSGEQPEIVYE